MGISTTKFESVSNLDELKQALNKIGYPAVLKTNNWGYDGKGQVIIRQPENVQQSWEKISSVFQSSGSKATNAILEGFIDFEKEISVIVGRGIDATTEIFPVQEV